MDNQERPATEAEKSTILRILRMERAFINILFSAFALTMLLTAVKIIYDLLGVFDIIAWHPREMTLIGMCVAFVTAGLFFWMFRGEAGMRTWTIGVAAWKKGKLSWRLSFRGRPLYYLDGQRIVAPFAWKLESLLKLNATVESELVSVTESSKSGTQKQLFFAMALVTPEGKSLNFVK